jgi:hypothetical protein
MNTSNRGDKQETKVNYRADSKRGLIGQPAISEKSERD